MWQRWQPKRSWSPHFCATVLLLPCSMDSGTVSCSWPSLCKTEAFLGRLVNLVNQIQDYQLDHNKQTKAMMNFISRITCMYLVNDCSTCLIWFLAVAEEECGTLGSHLLASHFLQEQITPASCQQLEAGLPKGYDVYRDPNFSEVIKCIPVLQGLMGRVQELREEWPDHPTLSQVR